MSKKFFYNERNGSQKGPFSTDELHLLAARGSLKPKSLIFDVQGVAFDADEVVDFKAIKSAKKSGTKSGGQTGIQWTSLIIRILIAVFFLGLAGYWQLQSNSIFNDASEVTHFQLSAQYSTLSLVALGFAIVCWFVSKPPNSPF